MNLRRLVTSHAFQACALNRSTISPAFLMLTYSHTFFKYFYIFHAIRSPLSTFEQGANFYFFNLTSFLYDYPLQGPKLATRIHAQHVFFAVLLHSGIPIVATVFIPRRQELRLHLLPLFLVLLFCFVIHLSTSFPFYL